MERQAFCQVRDQPLICNAAMSDRIIDTKSNINIQTDKMDPLKVKRIPKAGTKKNVFCPDIKMVLAEEPQEDVLQGRADDHMVNESIPVVKAKWAEDVSLPKTGIGAPAIKKSDHIST